MSFFTSKTRTVFLGAACLLAAGAAVQFTSPAFAAAPFVLKSTTVELPNSDQLFPAGPGSEVISANCLTCHSAGMVLNQPPLKKAAWEGEVKKMIAVYKAPVAEADVAAIVDYLNRIKGAP
jgi:cytochrome c5